MYAVQVLEVGNTCWFLFKKSKASYDMENIYRQDNIKADLTERGYEVVNWIELSQQNQIAVFCVSR
jgi:hypothetical protein